MASPFSSRKNDNKTQTTMPGRGDSKNQEFNDTMISKLRDAGVHRINHISRSKADRTWSTAGVPSQLLRPKVIEVHNDYNTFLVEGAAVEAKRAAPEDVVVVTTTHGMDFAQKGGVVEHHRGPTVIPCSENNYTAAPDITTITTGGGTYWIEGQTADMIRRTPKVALERIWEAFRKNSLNPAVNNLSFNEIMASSGIDGDLNRAREFIIGFLPPTEAEKGTRVGRDSEETLKLIPGSGVLSSRPGDHCKVTPKNREPERAIDLKHEPEIGPTDNTPAPLRSEIHSSTSSSGLEQTIADEPITLGIIESAFSGAAQSDAEDVLGNAAFDVMPNTTLIAANSTAEFIHEHRPQIQEALHCMGYTSRYLIQAGFNEDLLDAGIRHEEVFLFLAEDLNQEDSTICKTLSHIIKAPMSAVMYMPSRVVMIPPIPGADVPLSVQEDAEAPENLVPYPPIPSGSVTTLSSGSSSQNKQELGVAGNGQGSNESGGSNDQSDPEKPDHPDENGGRDNRSEERDDEDGEKKGKAKVRTDLPPERKILRSTIVSQIQFPKDEDTSEDDPLFEFSFLISITFSKNPEGKDPPPNMLSIDGHWCSIDIDWLEASSHLQQTHALKKIHASLGALSAGADLLSWSPVDTHGVNSGLKTKDERATKNAVGGKIGARPEVNLGQDRSNLEGVEMTHERWSITSNHRLGTVWSYVDTIWSNSKNYASRDPVFSETIMPGPKATFEYTDDDDLSERKLKISTELVWSALSLPKPSITANISRWLNLQPKQGNNQDALSQASTLSFTNFIQKLSFEIDLRKLPVGVSKVRDSKFQNPIGREDLLAKTSAALPVEMQLRNSPEIRIQVDRLITWNLAGKKSAVMVTTKQLPVTSVLPPAGPVASTSASI